MDYDDFSKLVVDTAKRAGPIYIGPTEHGRLRDLINIRIKLFTADTKCLYSDAVAFTIPITGVYADTPTAIYDIRDTDIFAKPMLIIEHVYVDSGQMCRISASDAQRYFTGYIFDDEGTPSYWMTQPPHHIRLLPTPSSAYSNSYVVGWYVHPELQFGGDELEIPDEYSQCAATYCATGLLEPDGSKSTFELMMLLDQRSAFQMRELESYAKTLTGGQRARGYGQAGSDWVSLV